MERLEWRGNCKIKLLPCESTFRFLCWRRSCLLLCAFCNLLLSFVGRYSTSSMKLSPIHQPTWGLLSLNTHSTHSPFYPWNINYTILWIGEVCKEVEWGQLISGSKRIQRKFQPSHPWFSVWPTFFSPLLFPQENYLSKSLRHFPTSYILGEILHPVWN